MQAALSRIKTDPVLKRFTAEVERIFPDRLEQVILYGSRARGDARPDSDYDIIVELSDAPTEQDKELLGEVARTIGDETHSLISAWFEARNDFERRSLFMHNLRREGVDLRRGCLADFPPIRESREEYVKAITANLLKYSRECLANAAANERMAIPSLAAREAYMAGFNAARALIFERTGKSPKTHSGVNTLFNEVARSVPELERALVSFLGDGYQFKAWADYHEGERTTAEQARRAIVTATRLVDAIERFISAES